MGGILQHAQVITNVATPLVVALLCLYAYHRRISKDDLLLWAAAHLVLALVFLAVNAAPPQGDPADLPLAWQVALFLYFCTSGLILAGVLAADDPRITFRRGLLVSLLAASAMIGLNALHPALLMYVGLPLNPLAYAAASFILIWRRRSIAHVIAGLVLLLRTVNGVGFVVTVVTTNIYMLPGMTSTLSVFLNFLTGISLLAIAVENAWRRLGAALAEARDARQEADAILDLAPASILRKDHDLQVVKANRYAKAMAARFGRQVEDMEGKRSTAVLPAEAAERMEQMDRRVLSDPTSGPIEEEISFTLPDGTKTTYLSRKTAIVDETGLGSGTMTISLDISHLKEVEASLLEQIALAEKASKIKSNFLANMSHELRTPLNAILGFTEMLAAGYLGPTTPRQKEYHDNILASGQHMLALVSSILDLSRMDSGKFLLQREASDLGALVSAAAEAARPMATEQGITLHCHTQPATASVDRGAIRQVLSNLISNAIRFNQPGGDVRMNVTQLGERACITIADTGLGMSDAQIAASSDPFLRGDPLHARPGGGMGLGLAISRSLVELHGGECRITSAPGQGTTITLLL